jgi:hypothetical protein
MKVTAAVSVLKKQPWKKSSEKQLDGSNWRLNQSERFNRGKLIYLPVNKYRILAQENLLLFKIRKNAPGDSILPFLQLSASPSWIGPLRKEFNEVKLAHLEFFLWSYLTEQSVLNLLQIW